MIGAVHRRIVDDKTAARHRNALEAHLAGEAMRRPPQRQSRVLQTQTHLRIDKPRLDEIDLAAHQRREGDLEMQFRGLDVGPSRRHGQLDVLELKIGGRQNLEIDAAADFDLSAGEVRKLRLDQMALGIPINEIRHRQSGS